MTQLLVAIFLGGLFPVLATSHFVDAFNETAVHGGNEFSLFDFPGKKKKLHSQDRMVTSTKSFGNVDRLTSRRLPINETVNQTTATSYPQVQTQPSTSQAMSATLVPEEPRSSQSPSKKTRISTHKPTKPPRSKQLKTPKPTALAYGTAIFYVVADSPYYPADARRLRKQMQTMPSDAEFVLHLGDIRNAATGARCTPSQYRFVANILKQSFAPVFLVLGDNDWNDCPDPGPALRYWDKNFLNLWDRFWHSNFDVTHMKEYPQNYYWVWKGTLFVGLDLPGSDYIFDLTTWNRQLAAEGKWTIGVIRDYKAQMKKQGLVGQAVLFAQANPTQWHQPFFKPLVTFIQHDLKNKMPILYLNGDTHRWNYQPNFFGQKSFLRINLTGETINPPLKIMIHGGNTKQIPSPKLFKYDRQLH